MSWPVLIAYLAVIAILGAAAFVCVEVERWAGAICRDLDGEARE